MKTEITETQYTELMGHSPNEVVTICQEAIEEIACNYAPEHVKDQLDLVICMRQTAARLNYLYNKPELTEEQKKWRERLSNKNDK